MKRGLVLVEGQTEEQFVNECLAPYLLAKGLILERPTTDTDRAAMREASAGSPTNSAN